MIEENIKPRRIPPFFITTVLPIERMYRIHSLKRVITFFGDLSEIE
jgi:hypothetical protein